MLLFVESKQVVFSFFFLSCSLARSERCYRAMTVRLNFNIAAVRAQTSLLRADENLAASLERLSSGIRIRRAADDPGGLVIANGMQHQLSGLRAATDNIENGIAMVQTAEGAMSEMSNILLKARELALTAANTATIDGNQLAGLQAELDEIIASVTRIADTSQFGGRRLLDGGITDSVLSDGRRDPFDNARSVYQQLIHDDARLPSGVQDNSQLTIAAPSSNLLADQLVVRLDNGGAVPQIDATLNGLNQSLKVGDTAQSDTIALSGGEGITITGPAGSQLIRLADDVTIRELVTVVNGYQDDTGAIMSFDERTGDLTITTTQPGLGVLAISSEDMTGGGVGLFDADVTSTSLAGVGIEPPSLSVDLIDSATGLPASSNSFIGNLTGNMGGLFDQALADVDGKHLSVMAGGEVTTVSLNGTTVDDVVAFMAQSITENGVAAAVSYDAATTTLTVTDTLTATTTNTVLGDTNSVADVMNTIAGLLTDPSVSYAAGTLNAGGESLTATGTTVQQVIDTINADTFRTGVTARLEAGQLQLQAATGPIVVQSDDLTLDQTQVGLLDLDTIDITSSGAIGNEPRIFAMDILNEVGSEIPSGDTALRRVLGNGFGFDAIDGTTLTLDDAVNPPVVINLTATTTIDDVVDQINAATVDARASYIDGSLRVVGSPQLQLNADPMNSVQPTHGLLDQGAGDPTSNGAAAIDRHPTIDLSYVDEAGIERQVQLVHDAQLDEGYGFRNILGGPQVIIDQANGVDRTIFTTVDPGAWQLSLRDTRSNGHSTVVATDRAMTAQRQSTLAIQSGAEANQITSVELRDLRATALGHSADLAREGYRNLNDLIDKQSLINGEHSEALQVIDAALEELNIIRGETGAIVSNGLEASLSGTRIAVEQLTDAESRIRDTDFAVESAEYARQNILLQAATSMLAQANQVPQSILQLLQ